MSKDKHKNKNQGGELPVNEPSAEGRAPEQQHKPEVSDTQFAECEESTPPDTQLPAKAIRARGHGLWQWGFSTAVTLGFIAVIVLFNVLFSRIGTRYSLRLDLTAGKLFQISNESVKLLSELDKDITIYVLNNEDAFLSSGSLYLVQVHDVLRQYELRSPHITLQYVDLPSNPGFERRYPQYQLNSSTILLESGEQTSTVSVNDLFNTEYDYYYGTEYIVSSKAEQTLTSAILGITTETQVTVSILEGFNESDSSALENLLRTNNYYPIRQNILTEEVNSDADAAIICAPLRDYTENELYKLDRFLQNGGEYGKTLFYFAGATQPPTPNLNAFLSEWGISVDDGIVFQTDYSKLVYLSNYWSIADYAEGVFSESVQERRLVSAMPESRPISLLFDFKENISVTAPLVFSDTALIAPLEDYEEWDPNTAEKHASIPAMALSTLEAYTDQELATSSVVVFGSCEFINQALLTNRTLGNAEYILSVINALTGHEETITIAPKTISGGELPLTGSNVITMSILFIIALPLVVLAMGCVTFFRRRNL